MPKAYGTAGPRAIYPDMCDSRTLARCGLMANALFPRLIVQSDDQGRLHGDAQDMAALCFPKMPRVHRDIAKALNELAAVKAIIRYEVDGEPYVQVASWWDYQAHQRRAYPSRFPAPEGWVDRVYGRWKDDNGVPDEALPEPAADSGDPPQVPAYTPQPAATRAGAHAGAVRSPSVPVGPHPSSSVPPAPAGVTTTGLSTNGTKKPEDEELLDKYLREWAAATSEDRRNLYGMQLSVMGIKDPAAELARRAA